MIAAGWLWLGVVTVQPNGPIKSLTAALAVAQSGDTIVVGPGVYREPATIQVGKRVVILGRDWPVIDGGGGHTLLRVTADSVVIEGLALRNVGPSGTEDRAAIRLEGVRGCAVRRNRILKTFFGIYLAKATDCRIEENELDGGGADESASGNAIHLWSSDRIRVAGNRVTGYRDGIYLEFVHSSELVDNLSRRNQRYGLHFMFSDSCLYAGNTFTENGAGVAVMYTKRVTMTGNHFVKNQGQAAYGLLLKDITDSRIERNEFADNTTGLYLDGANRLSVSGNRFQGNGWAVRLLANSFDDRFEANRFVGNTFDMSTNSRFTDTIIRRNYWDQYRGYDLDRNGVGDVPYRPVRLFSLVVEDNKPALILLRSLFVDVLDAAERLLPILTPEALVDREPLMEPPR